MDSNHECQTALNYDWIPGKNKPAHDRLFTKRETAVLFRMTWPQLVLWAACVLVKSYGMGCKRTPPFTDEQRHVILNVPLLLRAL